MKGLAGRMASAESEKLKEEEELKDLARRKLQVHQDACGLAADLLCESSTGQGEGCHLSLQSKPAGTCFGGSGRTQVEAGVDLCST